MSIFGSGSGYGRVNLQDSFTKAPAADIIGKPKRIGHNRFSYERADGSTVVRLRYTDILINTKDGRQVLNTDGWKTGGDGTIELTFGGVDTLVTTTWGVQITCVNDAAAHVKWWDVIVYFHMGDTHD